MRQACLAMAIASTIAGCSQRDTEESRRVAEALTIIDSVRLDESESFYIGKPSDRFAVGPDGSYYIVDQLADRLLQFDRSGAFIRPFGRRGMGPGEIVSAGIATAVVDTLLIHATMGRTIHTFNLDGTWLGRRSLRGFVTDVMDWGDRLLISNFDQLAGRGIAVVSKADLIRSDSLPFGSSMVKFPEEYAKYPDLDIINIVYGVAWPDTLAVAFGAVDQVVLYALDGTPVDTIRLPVRTRRSTSEKAYRLFLPGAGKMDERVGAISVITGLYRLPHDRLAVTHMDADAEMTPGRAFHLLSRVWVSILDRKEGQACVDIPVPAFASETARLTVVGDTLYALDQVLSEGESTPVTSFVRRYLIDPADCPWVPLGS